MIYEKQDEKCLGCQEKIKILRYNNSKEAELGTVLPRLLMSLK